MIMIMCGLWRAWSLRCIINILVTVHLNDHIIHNFHNK